MVSDFSAQTNIDGLDSHNDVQVFHNQTLDTDGLYGWKHSTIDPKTTQKIINDNTLIIIMFRDFKSWIHKMKKESYEKVPDTRSRKGKGMKMEEFLKSKWEPTNERHWQDIFQMRKIKYENWLDLSEKFGNNFLKVRYEDLVADGGYLNFFKKLKSHPFNLNCLPDKSIKPIESYAKLNKVVKSKRNVKFRESKEEFTFEPSDLAYVMTKIDGELERKLGYL